VLFRSANVVCSQKDCLGFVCFISIPLSLSASARMVLRVWLRCFTYRCASVLLHLAQIPRKFDGSCPPPASIGVM
jgi:hypothetical protein